MNAPSELGLEHLLQDGAWLRRFVGTLVAPQDVDDVVQSACLAAIEEPGRTRGSLAAWLRGVSANVARLLHRSRHRRARAFGRLPHPDDAPATANVVAGLEVQRAVSDALLALPEPTRTILVLRYQEGLSPAAIAPRVGLQVAAVRQRLHRGREAVRERLQQRFGADLRGCAAVAAFVHDARVAAPFAVVPAVALTALAAAVLAVTTLAVPFRADAPSPDTLLVTPSAAPSPVVTSAPTHPAIAATHTERTLVAAASEDPAPPATSPTSIKVRGRLIAAEDGSPIAGASIAGDSDASTPAVVSDHDGRFVVAYDATAKRSMLWFDAAGRCRRWCEHQQRSVDLGDIPMTRGYEVRGRVVDEHGLPLPNVRVETPLDGGVPDGSIGFPALTKADGTFAFAPRLLPAGPLALSCETSGLVLVGGNIDVQVAASGPNDFLLRVRRLRSMSGLVFDPEGRPCADVDLAVFPTAEPDPNLFVGVATRSAADGSFEIFDGREDWPAAFVDVGHHAAHELVGPRVRCDWGARGVRIVVRPLIPVRLLVVEAESGNAVTTYAAFACRSRGSSTVQFGGTSPQERPDGRCRFAGLAVGTHVVVFAPDPERAPVVLVVDEAMRMQQEVLLALPKLEAFALELVDARGAPVVGEFDVIDRRGIAAPDGWSDFLAGKQFVESPVPVMPFRVSSGKTDGAGKGTLLAPTDRRDLAICIQREERKLWIPVVLPAPGAALRIVVPD